MPPRIERCSQSRKVEEIMRENTAEDIMCEQFAHMLNCWPCRLAMVNRRDFPRGCSAPYTGYRAMRYLDSLTLSHTAPSSSPEGVIGMRVLLFEHRTTLEAAGVSQELINHVIDCPACVLDVLERREARLQRHRRRSSAPVTEF